MYSDFVKLGMDRLLAFVGFILVSPIFIIVTFFLLLANKGKAFFLQKRPGKNEQIFTIVKFKTMNDRKDISGNLLPDEKRLTRLGKFLRVTSLDEIPQLLNVIKGDMSFVGPRPLLPEYLPLYNDFQRKRHSVKPGITGWAQVNGRNSVSWNHKFELDVWYTQNQSFALDFKILLTTVKKVIFKEDINTEGHATTVPFSGN
ncbi:sugar transferase [Ulvibacter sp.]|nr:sugar transferase [Ulvibacter sp.]|tara:strand:- start:3483 stop:4085 length:603 start_codon:yes stop_codon:yes gene_type:complete